MDVVLAATGIGPGAAAICGLELLLCSANIREILFSGTSGFTPQVGAFLHCGERLVHVDAWQAAQKGATHRPI